MQASSSNQKEITTREELIYALSRAAELEHGLTCIYLFAAYSVKRFLHEGIDEIQQDQIRNWEAVVLAVAKQEMEHLGIVCNLLNAVGAPQHFGRPNLPQSPAYYSTQGSFTLEPFNITTIKRFMEFEKPATTDFAHGEVDGDGLVPDPIHTGDFHAVQELYATVLQGFVNLDASGDLFIGPPEVQVNDSDIIVGFDNREYGIEMVEVTDLESARRAVDVIIEQGEGIPIDQPLTSENGALLQRDYQKTATALSEIRKICIDDDNWKVAADQLLGIVGGLIPTLEHSRSVLEDETQYLLTQYTDPQWPLSFPRRMDGVIQDLREAEDRIRCLLNEDAPDDPVGRLNLIRSCVADTVEYDAEGIILSGFTNPESHYVLFWQIYSQLREIDYTPARNVARTPALRIHEDNKDHKHLVTIVDYPYSRQVMELCNACYETMVQMLILTFSYNEIRSDNRRLLFHTAFFPFMSMVIRPLSELLTLLPVRNPECWDDKLCTGSPFEFYIDVAFLPNRAAGNIYLQERLDQIAQFSSQLLEPPCELVEFMGPESLDYFKEQIAFLSSNLHRIRDNYAAGPQTPPS